MSHAEGQPHTDVDDEVAGNAEIAVLAENVVRVRTSNTQMCGIPGTPRFNPALARENASSRRDGRTRITACMEGAVEGRIQASNADEDGNDATVSVAIRGQVMTKAANDDGADSGRVAKDVNVVRGRQQGGDGKGADDHQLDGSHSRESR